MSEAITRVKWIEELTFLGVPPNGSPVVMSSSSGSVNGVSPMQMVLLGLGGCAGIDVIEILDKQRQPYTGLEIEIRGQKRQGTPSPWEKIDMHFVATGNVDPAKMERAVRLSAEKYCSVAATIAGVATIAWTYEVRAAETVAA